MLAGVGLRGPGPTAGWFGELGTRASAIERALGVAWRDGGGSVRTADASRAFSSSTSFVSVICFERVSSGSKDGTPGGGGAPGRPEAVGLLAWRAYASTSKGGLTVGRSFSSSASPGVGGVGGGLPAPFFFLSSGMADRQ
jgi:hypothetical protein